MWTSPHGISLWALMVVLSIALFGCSEESLIGLPPICEHVSTIVALPPEDVIPLMDSTAEPFRLALRGRMLHPPRSSGDSLLLTRADAEVDRLWASDIVAVWTSAFLVASEEAAGTDVASNAAHAYWRHRAAAAPMLIMLNDYSPGAERLALGLSAMTALVTREDTLLLTRLYCEALNQRDMFANSRQTWWEPMGDRYRRQMFYLEDAITKSRRLLGIPAPVGAGR